jgi:hypothetical protein
VERNLLSADAAILSFVPMVQDELNAQRPNLLRLLNFTAMDHELVARLQGGGERKFIYPLMFPTLWSAPDLLSRLSPDVLAAVRERRGVLLLDDSCEGPPMPEDLMAGIHQRIGELGLPADGVAIVNHNIDYQKWYNFWAQKNGVQDRLRIIYYHSWLIAASDQVSGLSFAGAPVIGAMLPDRAAVDQFILAELGGWARLDPSQRRRYLTMNFAARSHRVILMLYLLEHDLLARGDVSFGGISRKLPREYWEGQKAELAHFPQWAKLQHQWEPLVALGSLTLGGAPDPGDGSGLILDFAVEAHRRTAFSLVTETDFYFGKMRRITEKSLKPLLNLHPFITLGLPGTLNVLRGLGFKTFDGLIDETYDGVGDFEVRLELIFAEFQRLLSLSDADIELWRARLAPTLIHNAEHMAIGLPRVLHDSMNLPALRAIEAFTRRDS